MINEFIDNKWSPEDKTGNQNKYGTAKTTSYSVFPSFKRGKL
jgi:hypothetical protein